MAWRRSGTALRPGSKVIAVESLGDVPEGTRGVVKLVDGFRWTRYWVAWATGEWMGSIDGGSIVAADRYEDYKRERAEQAERATTAPVAVAAIGAGSDGEPPAAAAAGAGDGCPSTSSSAAVRPGPAPSSAAPDPMAPPGNQPRGSGPCHLRGSRTPSPTTRSVGTGPGGLSSYSSAQIRNL